MVAPARNIKTINRNKIMPQGKKQSEGQTKTGSQGAEDPAAGSMRPAMDEQYHEDAGISNPGNPEEGQQFAEDAAIAESQATLAGLDPALLEIKSQIEAQLAATAASGAAVEAESAITGAGNIVGVGLGAGIPEQGEGLEALTEGGDPGDFCLNVYVVEPTAPEQVRAAIVESMGISAASSADVRMNVIVTGVIDAQPHRWKLRPAPGGVSVAHVRVTAGTIGCLAVGRTAPRNSRRLLLSNNHVLANSNSAAYGDCICQPGPADGGTCPGDQIAILERFVPINFGGAVNYVDCATGWTWHERVRPELVYVSGGALRYFRIGSVPVNFALNQVVGKSGRTTQLTTGRVIGISESLNCNYGGGRVALFRDQYSIRSVNANPFSAGGDSGSSIWTWDSARRPGGLLFAGGGGITFANKMTRVVAALDINLFT